MEKSTLEEIKMKNPFMYIIKLSESKKRNKSKSNTKNKKGFITPIKPRNESRSKISSNTKKPKYSKKEDYINEINSLKNQLAQKEAALSKAKTEINDLLKENITLKAKVSQYKEKIDNMTSDAHILSKETLSNFFNIIFSI